MGDAVTWLGHASVLVELDGVRVLTDPVLTDRVAHLRRRRPLSPELSAPGRLDAVLVSHVHMDHLHPRSLRSVAAGAVGITSVGAGRLLARAGFSDVREVVVGDEIEIGAVTVAAVPAKHKRARGPHTRVEADPIGFVVRGRRHSVYFAGDTDLFPGMADLRGVTVALLPIWGWGPTIGEGHLDPARAAEATVLIDPQVVVPIHWGTLTPEDGRRSAPAWLDDAALDFRAQLAATPYAGRLRLLLPGGRLDLDGHLDGHPDDDPDDKAQPPT
jgi:L-ascorbate metabolism protein UlaG (beta-lactamase superfamily)